MGPRTDAVIPIVSMEQTNSCPLRRCTLAPCRARRATAPRIMARACATMCTCNNMADFVPRKLSEIRVVGLPGLTLLQAPQSARREDDGEGRGHAERDERPDPEKDSAGVGDPAANKSGS